MLLSESSLNATTNRHTLPESVPVTPVSWVVYLMTIGKRAAPMHAVCEQSEWSAIELSRPGHHKLVCSGIATEVQAEALARSISRDPLPIRN
jgi:hypothetical protein